MRVLRVAASLAAVLVVCISHGRHSPGPPAPVAALLLLRDLHRSRVVAAPCDERRRARENAAQDRYRPLGAPLASGQASGAGEFRWAPGEQDLGPVDPAVAAGEGWRDAPGGAFRYRRVSSWSGDPVFELVLPAPRSGHPTLSERALVQLPQDFLERPLTERAALVAFHSFGKSEKEIFLDSDLAWHCRSRGWLLVAPYGLMEGSFASPASQSSLEALLHALHDFAPFDHRRVYAAGFSMGGLAALSFAMRHQDPAGVRVAGVVFHTGPLDVARVHAEAPRTARAVLEHPYCFGGTPDEVPFEYARVSPVRFLASGLVDPDHAPVVHLEHVPIFLHANLADPDAGWLAGLFELEQFLLARGADLRESFVFDPDAGHDWSTLPTGRALDVLGGNVLGGVPATAQVFADRPVPYGAAEVRDLPRSRHARFALDLDPGGLGGNAFALEDTRELNELAVVPRRAGLDTSRELAFRWSSADGTGDRVVLPGYLRLPSAVTFDGGAPPPRSWWWNEPRGELVVELPPAGAAIVVAVRP